MNLYCSRRSNTNTVEVHISKNTDQSEREQCQPPSHELSAPEQWHLIFSPSSQRNFLLSNAASILGQNDLHDLTRKSSDMLAHSSLTVAFRTLLWDGWRVSHRPSSSLCLTQCSPGGLVWQWRGLMKKANTQCTTPGQSCSCCWEPSSPGRRSCPPGRWRLSRASQHAGRPPYWPGRPASNQWGGILSRHWRRRPTSWRRLMLVLPDQRPFFFGRLGQVPIVLGIPGLVDSPYLLVREDADCQSMVSHPVRSWSLLREEELLCEHLPGPPDIQDHAQVLHSSVECRRKNIVDLGELIYAGYEAGFNLAGQVSQGLPCPLVVAATSRLPLEVLLIHLQLPDLWNKHLGGTPQCSRSPLSASGHRGALTLCAFLLPSHSFCTTLKMVIDKSFGDWSALHACVL